jgi:hypothetical protein
MSSELDGTRLGDKIPEKYTLASNAILDTVNPIIANRNYLYVQSLLSYPRKWKMRVGTKREHSLNAKLNQQILGSDLTMMTLIWAMILRECSY